MIRPSNELLTDRHRAAARWLPTTALISLQCRQVSLRGGSKEQNITVMKRENQIAIKDIPIMRVFRNRLKKFRISAFVELQNDDPGEEGVVSRNWFYQSAQTCAQSTPSAIMTRTSRWSVASAENALKRRFNILKNKLYLKPISGLRMRSVTWYRFHIFFKFPFPGSPKVFSKPRACNCWQNSV